MTKIALQNGSDIRGIAYAQKDLPANLTPESMEPIAKGVIRWLCTQKQQAEKWQAGQLKIGIGHDSRITADALKNALVNAFVAFHVQVLDFGLATTPAMFMATQFAQYDCDLTIMITASHLPYYYNGLKLFTKEGGLEASDITKILTHSEIEAPLAFGTVQKCDLLTDYTAYLVAKIKAGMQTQAAQPLAGFHIIVDAGNGAGGFFVDVLEALGADTTGSQFLAPDGYFPNHIPNPDNEEAMQSIQQAVLAQQADLGVIFDTDVDRSAVVDANGMIMNRNKLIAVLATIVLDEQPNSTIVTNSPTTDHLKAFIEEKGGKQVRYISGYRNVIGKMIALNAKGINTPLAIETSGHAAFRENFDLDDGAYVIAKILMLLPTLAQKGQTLTTLIASLKQPAETAELRLPIQATDVVAYGQGVIRDLAAEISTINGLTIDPENEEGLRVTATQPFGVGWLLLRLSLHEPLLVLRVENDEVGQNKHLLATLAPFFSTYAALDTRTLQQFLTTKTQDNH